MSESPSETEGGESGLWHDGRQLAAHQGGWVVPFAAAVGMACYLNSAACSFVFDDQFAIVTNKDVLEPPPSLPQ